MSENHPPRRGPSMKLVLLISVPVLLAAAIFSYGLVAWDSRRDVEARLAALPEISFTPDPIIEAARRGRELVGRAVVAQGAALLSGDAAAFTGSAAPAARRWLTGRFANLRALGVARWDPVVTSFDWDYLSHRDSDEAHRRKQFRVVLEVAHCFGAGCARTMKLAMFTTWSLLDEARPRLLTVEVPTFNQSVPPWATSDLVVRAGSRVVVAATTDRRGQLDEVLPMAERAARVADGWAIGPRPGRYVVYLAGTSEWNRWSRFADPWAAGVALVEQEATVLRPLRRGADEMNAILRHELGHVSTLAGRAEKADRKQSWWLTEGLADFIEADGERLPDGFPRAEVAAYLRNGKNGTLLVEPPKYDSPARVASVRYGVAFLGVRCLMDTYGRDRTLGFFEAVSVRGEPVAGAAGKLGAPWADVQRTCVPYLSQGVR